MKTRNISLSKELDNRALELMIYLKELGYDRCYSSIVRECLLMSIDKIKDNYKMITSKGAN
jgi:hypothetical protein